MNEIVSIIVPVYNAEKTLGRCIDSILKQTYTYIEIVLIDDGSKDNSSEICNQYSAKDYRIHVFHKTNEGVSAARNLGLSKASGKYVMFVDSDDAIQEECIQTYVNVIENNDVDVVIGGYVRIENGEQKVCIPEITGVYGNELWNRICTNSEPYGYICNKLFKMNIIRANDICLRTDMYSQEDLEFCLSIYEKCEKFYLLPYAGYKYYYVSGKRKPPIWDFVSNQLKLVGIANRKTILSDEAKECVKRRIALLIYSFLYYANKKEEFRLAIQKLINVDGLREYLKNHFGNRRINNEHELIINFFLKGHYQFIYLYFCVRNKIRDFIRLAKAILFSRG